MGNKNMLSGVTNWVRELPVHFFPALLPAWRVLRYKGIYMCVCTWPLRGVPVSVRVPGLGRLRTREEFCNYLGNFCSGELRCAEAEEAIRTSIAPVVVDVGVNVGMTVRHWLALTPSVTVVGLDMMKESLEHTGRAVREAGNEERWHGICGVVTSQPGQWNVSFDDPLSGLNSVQFVAGTQHRAIPADTLDNWLMPFASRNVTIIKIDVEGHGAAVLTGATEVLKRSEFVVLEIHSNDELERSAKILFQAGWLPFLITGRNTWWRRDKSEEDG